MSDAFQCDSCAGLFEGKPTYLTYRKTGGSAILGTNVKTKLDAELCEGCRDRYFEFIGRDVDE